VDWNRDDPLARCKGETRRANDALRAYYLMGSGRSLDRLVEQFRVQFGTKPDIKPPSLRRSTLAEWSSKFDWQARVDRAKELDDEAQLKQWEQRRQEWKQEEWDAARKLLDKVEQMLQFPVGETVSEHPDGSVVIVKPAKWRAPDIARYLDTASKLARLAAEMETERAKSQALNIEVSDLSDDELERIANGEDPLHVLATSRRGGVGTETEGGQD
jgi:hypothetical protein